MYDVIIVGSGMAGTMLGSILSRHDLNVAILDAGKHPRFTIGEATLRETTMMMKLMADRFDVPELAHTSSYVAVTENIGVGSGMKRSIGYAYHRRGEPQRPDEIYQVTIPETFDGPEIHYCRAETDEYLAKVAVKYGCTLREETKVDEVDISDDVVTVTTSAGEVFTGKFIVDAGSFRSVLADKFGLREQPTRLRSNSRSLFTHMKGVKRYEDVGSEDQHLVPQRWSQGTLHQCFDGGWMWVIPFNNGPETTGDRVSIGLQLDNRKHPFTGMEPEEEFRSIIADYPSLADQFADAEAIRPWKSTGARLQYSASTTIGHRFCLTAAAMGSTGPLMSRGLILTTRTMYPLAEILIDAVADDDFSVERFRLIDEILQGSLDQTDMMCEGFYESWRDWDLFNAWMRVWYTTGVLGFFHMEAAYSLYKRTRDSEAVIDLLFGKNPGSVVSAIDDFQPYIARVGEIMRSVIDDGMDPKEAANRLVDLIDSVDFLPPGFHFTDLDHKSGGPFTRDHWEQIIRWGNFDAPPQVKEAMYPGDPETNVDNFMDFVDQGFASERLKPIREFILAGSRSVDWPTRSF
jgi:FADH2 O2-dependent halogenase